VTLQDEGARLGFSATGVPLVGDGPERWSSTAIRSLVQAGDMAAAAAGLGRLYALDGEVVHGDHRGRELGYPTANLAWAHNPVIPADGVYAGWLLDAGERLPAAVSVGTNPQFNGRDRRVEAHVIDRTGLDLYGDQVRVEFLERLRDQATFDDVPGLMRQMDLDVDRARRLTR
jgi:riboflavin kinase/FMN adenylyltransferase